MVQQINDDILSDMEQYSVTPYGQTTQGNTTTDGNIRLKGYKTNVKQKKGDVHIRPKQ